MFSGRRLPTRSSATQPAQSGSETFLTEAGIFGSAVVQCLIGFALLALTTFACFELHINLSTTTVLYLVVIMLISYSGGFVASSLVALLAVGCLSYFFAQPIFSFRVTDPLNVVTLIAFLMTSVVISHLFAKVRNSSDERLELANNRLLLALEAGQAGGWDWDIKSGGSSLIGSAFALIGVSPEAFSGSVEEFWKRVHSEDVARLREALRTAKEKHADFDQEFRVIWPDGSVHWLRSHGRYFYANDEPVRMMGISVDITTQKEVEEKALESAELLRLAAKAGRMYAYHWDVATDVVVRSGEGIDILGLRGDKACDTRREIATRVHPDDLAKFMDSVAGLTPEHPDAYLSFRMLRPDGQVVWLEKTGRAFFDEHGRMLRTIGMVADVTERKQAEEALRESEERLRLAAQVGRMYAYEWDVATDIIVRSEEHTNILGLSREPALLKRQQLMGQVHPDDRRKFIDSVSQLTPENPSAQITYRVLRPDGSIVWLEKTGRAFFDEQGRMQRTIGMVADITSRKMAEEALQQKEAELREAQRLAGVGSWKWDLESGTFTWSEELYELSGRDPSTPAPSHKEREHLYTPDSWNRLRCAEEEALRNGTPFELDIEMICADGSEKWITARGEPRRDANGRIVQLRGTVQDITDRKRAHEALVSLSRRLILAQEQERARIARDLHDDIGQRLAFLALALEATKQGDSIDQVRARLEELRNQTAEIAKNIQALSHELHSPNLELLGIVAAMRTFCAEFAEQQKAAINFTCLGVPEPVPQNIALCLFRVLQEALHNAVKHSGVRRFDVELRGLREEVSLTVRDAGQGFDTNAAVNNHGLGLVSMRERLESVEGVISIDSLPERGTTIYARVPLKRRGNSFRAVG